MDFGCSGANSIGARAHTRIRVDWEPPSRVSVFVHAVLDRFYRFMEEVEILAATVARLRCQVGDGTEERPRRWP